MSLTGVLRLTVLLRVMRLVSALVLSTMENYDRSPRWEFQDDLQMRRFAVQCANWQCDIIGRNWGLTRWGGFLVIFWHKEPCQCMFRA